MIMICCIFLLFSCFRFFCCCCSVCKLIRLYSHIQSRRNCWQPPFYTSVIWLHVCYSLDWLIVLKTGRSPPPKKKISAHVYCGQTAGWIKMALGIEVGLMRSRRLCVRWGPSSSPKSGRSPLPNFRQISTVSKGPDAWRCHLVWR